MAEVALSKQKSEEICAHLEETAELIGAPIEKSLESIGNLEGVLLSLKEMSNEESFKGGIFMAGIYLGEILIEQLGGRIFSEQYDQLAVLSCEQCFFPLEKINKFVQKPEDEGLDFCLRAIVAKNQ